MGLGSIIGGVAGAIGSIAGINSQNQANAFSREQFEYQKELHRNQMQWRVEDAKKAGLHPMAALGLSSMSFSPVSTSPVDYSGLTNSLSNMGQNIDSAIMNAKTKEQQKEAVDLQNKSIALDLRGKDLNNQILEQELASKRAQLALMTGPPSPSTSGLPSSKYAIPGQTGSDLSIRSPMENMDRPIVEHGFLKDSKGRLVDVIPSDDWKGRVEDTLIVEWLPWLSAAIKNGRAKLFGSPIDGYYWHSDRGEYLPYPPKKESSEPAYMKYMKKMKPFSFRFGG